MTEITGILRDAVRVPLGDDVRAPCLCGHVFGDTKGRFRAGDWITTSTIMSEEGDIFRTRYSVYKVESWADGTPVAANDNVVDAKLDRAVAMVRSGVCTIDEVRATLGLGTVAHGARIASLVAA